MTPSNSLCVYVTLCVNDFFLIQTWNLKDGKSTITLRGHYAPVTCVCCLPDEIAMVITGSTDGTIRLWSMENDFK